MARNHLSETRDEIDAIKDALAAQLMAADKVQGTDPLKPTSNPLALTPRRASATAWPTQSFAGDARRTRS